MTLLEPYDNEGGRLDWSWEAQVGEMILLV